MSLTELPDEMLVQICKKLDVPTLVKLSETYSNLYNICGEIIEGKKEEYILDRKVNQILDTLTTQGSKMLRFNTDNPAKIAVLGLFYMNNKFLITLRTSKLAGLEYLEKIWMFSVKAKFSQGIFGQSLAKFETNDVQIIREGIRKSIVMGFD